MKYRNEGEIYLDVGISTDVNQYFNVKETKYKDFGHKVIPIVFGKDCTVHPKSLEWLLKFGISESAIFEQLGRLLGLHFMKCEVQIAGL